jgi:hypothetical protein
MFRIHAEYLGALGLTSHFLSQSYNTREEAEAAALAMNCKSFTPYFFRVVAWGI